MSGDYQYLRPGTIIEVYEDYTIYAHAFKGGQIRGSVRQTITLVEGDMVEFLGTRLRAGDPERGLIYLFLHIPHDQGEPTGDDMTFYVANPMRLIEGIGYEVE